MGFANERLAQVAKHVTESYQMNEIDFVVALGDNCYRHPGRFWNAVFEEPFKNVTCPWYPILGNHDYDYHGDDGYKPEKNGDLKNADWMLKYSAVDPRWRMPHIYYNQTFGNLMEIIFIDTTILCPVESQNLFWENVGLYSETEPLEQYRWIEERLAASTAHWKVVCGHYPIYCHGTHEGTKELQKLERLMHANNADVYICGHDHSLQHHYNKQRNIHHLISGATSGVYDYDDDDDYERAKDKKCMWRAAKAGYLHIDVNLDSMNLKFLQSNGQELYKFSISKP
jgi:tartrate-resistant acid phosphatase type 5